MHPMDPYLPLYSWIRGGRAIHLARIEEVRVAPGNPGQEQVDVTLGIEETFWGAAGPDRRHYRFEQPQSELARLKFPHPVWGRVNLRQGASILLVERAPAEDPDHVDEVAADDPVMASVGRVAAQENLRDNPEGRVDRYLRWVKEGSVVERLFGGEALAKDPLPGVDPEGRIAPVLAGSFAGGPDVFVRLTLGEWLWQRIYAKTNATGRRTIIHATVLGGADKNPDLSRFSLDRLSEVDPVDLRGSSLTPPPEVILRLEERMAAETAPMSKAHLVAVIHALRGDEDKR